MAWFRIAFAEKAFLRILGNHGWRLDSITVDEGVAAMLEFYTQHRAQHTDLEDDDDGLLLKWGNGRLGLTRQLIRSGNPDNPIRQLSLRFVVEHALPAAGSMWHFDPTEPIDVPAFFTGTPLQTILRYDEV
jgi:hypothetical protein